MVKKVGEAECINWNASHNGGCIIEAIEAVKISVIIVLKVVVAAAAAVVVVVVVVVVGGAAAAVEGVAATGVLLIPLASSVAIRKVRRYGILSSNPRRPNQSYHHAINRPRTAMMDGGRVVVVVVVVVARGRAIEGVKAEIAPLK